VLQTRNFPYFGFNRNFAAQKIIFSQIILFRKELDYEKYQQVSNNYEIKIDQAMNKLKANITFSLINRK